MESSEGSQMESRAVRSLAAFLRIAGRGACNGPVVALPSAMPDRTCSSDQGQKDATVTCQ